MKNVGILFICTGKYDIFWKDFYLSCEKYFLKDCKKKYYVFTDSPKLYGEDINKNIIKIYQENLGWPGNTLMRFHIFAKVEKEIAQNDYLYFFNANCEFKKEIKSDLFLPLEENLLFVQHPGYYKVSKLFFPYDRNKKSTAYIPFGKGNIYICGGINGGKSYAFINLINKLAQSIDVDTKNGVIAKWHDESQINKYIIGRDDFKILPPSFCYPEGSNIKLEPMIVVRNKEKYFNVDNLKKKSFYARLKSMIRKFLQKINLM